MFFKKKTQEPSQKLSELVLRNHRTGYVFVDINNDLGDAAEAIMANTPIIKMTYGYARRTAALAMYAQGLIDKSVLDHVQMVFKSLQLGTEQSKDFQERAFDDSIAFMQTYNWQINKLNIIGIRRLVDEYEQPQNEIIPDAQLVAAAIDAIHQDQESQRPMT
ncbi:MULTISPECIES: hypothetical protein [unclassified Pseudomonas]|uniref:hypothetical protein n=1 Tax=unclassified Pseudomonas TaxID=196821 RepID=UPI000A1DC47E|nr:MULTISPECIES: hypothetical protein [unclassified Pseudomonas]